MFPQLEDGDQAFPKLVNELLPSGLRGLFVAAFLAALMSSIDSYLNSAATIVSHDLYRRFVNPGVTDEQLLGIGRLTTLGLVTWAILFAFLLQGMSEDSGLYAIFQTLMAFFQGPALAISTDGDSLAPRDWHRRADRIALRNCDVGVSVHVESDGGLYCAWDRAPVPNPGAVSLFLDLGVFSLTVDGDRSKFAYQV
jgi:SSS family solute:Na+ symporter